MNSASGFDVALASALDGLRPDPPLCVDAWSECYMHIPSSLGVAEPGKYHLDRTPYAREVMQWLSPDHPCEMVVVMAASQMLKTQCGLNWISAVIVNTPANAIIMMPSDTLVNRIAERFDATVEAVEALRMVVAPKRSRSSGNRINRKKFRGGDLKIVTGASSKQLKEATARYLWVDEVDEMDRELAGQGDPLGQFWKRGSTFGRRVKKYLTSTPTLDGVSRIKAEFDKGDQNHCEVPCPHCGEYQTLDWERMQYDLKQRKAWYVCVNGCSIEEHSKSQMLSRYRWTPAVPGNGYGQIKSATINYLYAPLGWDSWLKLAEEYEEARLAEVQGDPELMQVFCNTRLARVWSPLHGATKPEALKERAEDFPLGIAPKDALMLTAACDVQHNRLEMQIIGWGFGPCGLEPWTVNVHVIHGNTTLDEPWSELDKLLKTPIRHASGALLVIRAVMVDASDGNRSDEIYEFCRQRKRRWIGGKEQIVMAVKGHAKPGKPAIANKPTLVDINHKGRFVPQGAELWLIGTDTAKDWLFNRLELAGHNAIHFSRDLPLEYYRQLLAETRQIIRRRAQKLTVFTLKKGEANEMLDTFVYNYAAACWLGLPRWTAEHWQAEANRLQQSDLFIQVMPTKVAENPAANLPAITEVIDELPAVSGVAPRRIHIPPTNRPGGVGLGREGWNI